MIRWPETLIDRDMRLRVKEWTIAGYEIIGWLVLEGVSTPHFEVGEDYDLCNRISVVDNDEKPSLFLVYGWVEENKRWEVLNDFS